MKLLYVGDNRPRSNWGCRATSMALGSLLRREHEVAEIIQGDETGHLSSYIPWDGLPPVAFWTAVDAVPSPFFGKVRRRIKQMAGITDDFIRHCPRESVERFHHLRPRLPQLQEMYRKVQTTDAVVINGEGTYIFPTPPRREALYFSFILQLAQDLGKKTFVLNAMFSDCPKTGRNEETFAHATRLLNACNAISTRDRQSLETMAAAGVKPLSYHPDALFTWVEPVQEWKNSIHGKLSTYQPFGQETHQSLPEIDFDQPYICLSGSSSAAWQQETAYHAYRALAEALSKAGVPLLLVPTCSGDRFFSRIAEDLSLPFLPTEVPIRLGAAIAGKAAVWVSGRFHPSIAASCGGTPCVFMDSNSHKTSSLQEVLEYEDRRTFPDLPDAQANGEIVERVKTLLATPGREQILAVARKRAQEAEKVISLLNQ